MADITGYERRSYSRFKTDVEAVAYCAGVNHEIRCRVCDISEEGLCITADTFDGWEEHLTKGRTITVQFVDEYPFGRGTETECISIRCNIRHVKEENDRIIAGCFAADGGYGRYVKFREAGINWKEYEDKKGGEGLWRK